MRKLKIVVCAVLISTAATAAPSGEEDRFHPVFERLKTLVGTWHNEDRGEVRYFLTGNGSAVVEVFANMSSVYHMDGDVLMLTHYCGADNHPRMKAVDYDEKTASLQFDFIDVTNVSDPEEYYTREVGIVFQDEDHIEVRFNGIGGGEEFPVVLPLVRKGAER